MPDVSSAEAAQIIGISSQTIRRLIDRELLPARKQGLRGLVRVELDDLRKFAEEYNYKFDDRLAEVYQK